MEEFLSGIGTGLVPFALYLIWKSLTKPGPSGNPGRLEALANQRDELLGQNQRLAGRLRQKTEVLRAALAEVVAAKDALAVARDEISRFIQNPADTSELVDCLGLISTTLAGMNHAYPLEESEND